MEKRIWEIGGYCSSEISNKMSNKKSSMWFLLSSERGRTSQLLPLFKGGARGGFRFLFPVPQRGEPLKVLPLFKGELEGVSDFSFPFRKGGEPLSCSPFLRGS